MRAHPGLVLSRATRPVAAASSHGAKRIEQHGSDCTLRVRDTGIGISPELLPRIFDLFIQASPSFDRSSKGGLGIGLALVKRLVELHQGRVEAHSVLGKGSEFVVTLHLAR